MIKRRRASEKEVVIKRETSPNKGTVAKITTENTKAAQSEPINKSTQAKARFTRPGTNNQKRVEHN
jgi:hypothetical protein